MNKINNFISKDESDQILSFVNSINIDLDIKNKHISEVAIRLNGNSYMFDISKTELSHELATYQSSNNLIDLELPPIFLEIMDRISCKLNISSDNVFLQILSQESGGLIHPHYDSSIDGYITYKCNVCILSGNYQLFIEDKIIDVNQCDLYSFEASLYKHWTEPFNDKRVILSFGFILPYSDLGRNEFDPRVRLSKRIIKYFQKQ
jgi:hypothetical protein